uniref:Uncharacterized protein n=1 Tax=Metapenaeus ensis majanivirus TaxID=2984279 RepID=A0A9C7F0I2_9VIRU|nr:MAG: hypothetical protein [Metapenaeus ensis majanivirus]
MENDNGDNCNQEVAVVATSVDCNWKTSAITTNTTDTFKPLLFKSLVSSIKKPNDIKTEKEFNNIIHNLMLFERNISPWEKETIEDILNLNNINSKNMDVDRLYFFDIVKRSPYSKECLLLLRLFMPRYHHRKAKSLYLKIDTTLWDDNPFGGKVYITANPQTFFSFICHSNHPLFLFKKQRNEICKLMIEDNDIQMVNPLMSTITLLDNFNFDYLFPENDPATWIKCWDTFHININSQTIDCLYHYSKEHDNEKFFIKLKPSHHNNFQNPLYASIKAKINNNIPRRYRRGRIRLFSDAQLFFNLMSYDNLGNIDEIYKSMIKDNTGIVKLAATLPSSFKSLVPSITTPHDIFNDDDNKNYHLINFQRILEKEISPWERDELWDKDNININTKNVDRVYYVYHRKNKINQTKYTYYYQFLGRLEPIHHHRYQKPLYVKLEMQYDQNDTSSSSSSSSSSGQMMNDDSYMQYKIYNKIKGSIYITANPQNFLCMATYYRNYDYHTKGFNFDSIYKSMIKDDNVQVSKFLPPKFECKFQSSRISSIEKPMDNVGLKKLLPCQILFKKRTSPWEYKNKILPNLQDIIIRPEMVDCIYLCESESKYVYTLYARLVPNYYYHREGCPLYVHFIAVSRNCFENNNSEGLIYDSDSKGLIYVTCYPLLFFKSIYFKNRIYVFNTNFKAMEHYSEMMDILLDINMKNDDNDDDDDDGKLRRLEFLCQNIIVKANIFKDVSKVKKKLLRHVPPLIMHFIMSSINKQERMILYDTWHHHKKCIDKCEYDCCFKIYIPEFFNLK